MCIYADPTVLILLGFDKRRGEDDNRPQEQRRPYIGAEKTPLKMELFICYRNREHRESDLQIC